MLQIKITDNIPEVSREILYRILNVRLGIQKACLRSAMFVKGQAQRHLTGEFLKVRTGRLRSSVTTSAQWATPIYRSFVGTNVWYGQLWESGRAIDDSGHVVTLKNRVLRPWLSEAVERKQNTIRREIVRALKGALGG